MRVFKTMIGTDDGHLIKADTIEHDGGLWIVPKWLEDPSEAVSRPAYIIRIDHLSIQKTPNSAFGDFVLQQGCIPRDVLSGTKTSGQNGTFEVIHNPELRIQGGKA